MTRTTFFATAFVVAALGICAPRPASAQSWVASNAEIVGTPSTYGSGSGCTDGAYTTGGSASSTSYKHTDSTNTTNAGGTFTVNRLYTKYGSPSDATVALYLSVSGSVSASGLYGFAPGAYANAKSKAKGDSDQFPFAMALDETAYASYPTGSPTGGYSPTNSTDTNASRSINDTITLTGTIYLYTDAMGNNQTASSDASTELDFGEPQYQ